jgi:hypothetical protein
MEFFYVPSRRTACYTTDCEAFAVSYTLIKDVVLDDRFLFVVNRQSVEGSTTEASVARQLSTVSHANASSYRHRRPNRRCRCRCNARCNIRTSAVARSPRRPPSSRCRIPSPLPPLNETHTYITPARRNIRCRSLRVVKGRIPSAGYMSASQKSRTC